MPSKPINPQFSICISNVCEMIGDATSDYEWNKNEVNRLDRLTQDYLHILELEDIGYGERAKIATKIKRCRQLRRQSKDTVETLQPFIEFIKSEKGKQMMNLMRETLGKTRKAEERMSSRIYRYKILEAER